MKVSSLAKITSEKALTIVQLCQLQEAQAELQPEHTPVQFFQLLLEKKYYADAVRFLAHGLPKREAVWWACVCVEGVLDKSVTANVQQALQAAKQWVYEPNEAHRCAAEAATEKAGTEEAATWAAMAAFWSGGSLMPADKPVVVPGETLTAHAVACSVMLAAVKDPKQIEQRYQQFLRQGVHIANGGNGLIHQQANEIK